MAKHGSCVNFNIRMQNWRSEEAIFSHFNILVPKILDFRIEKNIACYTHTHTHICEFKVKRIQRNLRVHVQNFYGN